MLYYPGHLFPKGKGRCLLTGWYEEIKMMYHNKNMKVNMNISDMKMQRRVLTIICLLLLAGCIVLGMMMVRNSAYRTQAQQQLSQRVITSLANAVDEVNRMSGVAASNTSARLARARQYVYHMGQLNDLSIQLSGGESGRLISETVMETLYADLDAFEALVQGSKNSTMDIRTQLLNHLTTLQTVLIGN